MARPRPVNLNLFTIRQPVAAVVSILHRMTGFLLFLMVPFLVWALSLSLYSANSFIHLQEILSLFWVKFIVWAGLAGLCYHLLAGIRHFVMNFGFAESLVAMRWSARLVLALAMILAIVLGVWLW